MSRLRLPLVLALFLAALAPVLRGFVFIEGMPAWPDGTVTLQLHLGGAPVYSDGTTPNSTAVEALQIWNPSMARVQLAYVDNSTSSKSRTNGLNDVSFDSSVYGTAFGDGVLAVTVARWSSDGAPIEADVVVNSARDWDSYRGFLGLTLDLRRVLIHEFGHVLGLGHPDDSSQWVDAIMNSRVGNVYTPRKDDKEGLAARYGAGPGSSIIPPTFTSPPFGGSYVEGQSIMLSPWATGSSPVRFQWFKDGAPVTGATDRELRLAPIRVADAGSYFVRATNDGGGDDSMSANIWVTAAQLPAFSTHPRDTTVTNGMGLQLYGSAESNATITYQWMHNGIAVPGATSNTLQVASATGADEGTYRLVATSFAGSVTSEAAVVQVNPMSLPRTHGPANQAIDLGGALTLNTRSQDFPTRYQWYHDGVPIDGATNSSYTVANVSSDDAGEYFVVLTNAAGSTTSGAGIISVLSPDSRPTYGWRQVFTHGEIVHFLFDVSPRIERFDLTSETWFPAVSLPRAPSAMALINAGSAVVAFGRTISRIDLANSQESVLATLDSDPLELAVHQGRLYILAKISDYTTGARVGTLDLATSGGAVAWWNPPYMFEAGILISPKLGRLFAILPDRSYPALSSTSLQPDGLRGSIVTRQITDPRASPKQIWLSPDETLLFDDSGCVTEAASLLRVGDLNGLLDSIAFLPDGTPLTLQGRRVTGYADNMIESGSMQLEREASFLAVREDTLYAFSQPTTPLATATWQRRSLTDLVGPSKLATVSAATLDYLPDNVLIDRDGTVLLLSRIHGNIFRWSTHEQRYLAPIPLTGRPNHVTYLPDTHRIYLGYPNDSIHVIDLAQSGHEEVFAKADRAFGGLEIAGEFLAVSRFSGYFESLSLLSSDATRVAAEAPFTGKLMQAWNGPRRRIYWLSSNWLSYTEVTASGALGATVSTSLIDRGFPIPPIRFSESGGTVLVGDGNLYDADTLVQKPALSIRPLDAIWLGDELFTARDTHSATMIERWKGPDSSLDGARPLPGRIIRLFRLGTDRLVVVTHKSGRTHFTLLDADLNIRNHFEDTPDLTKVALTNLSTRADVGTGDNIIIAGFVVTGSQSKRILVRAVGPGLNRFGVSGTLADPVLTVISDGGPVAENDNWFTPDGDALKLAFREVFAFGLADASLDSALVATLAPGKYTAQVSGKNGSQGVALVEAYDLDADPGERRLINISTRAVVGIGDKVLIPGLAVEGTEPKRLLIRAVGPELTRFQVAGVLADPQLKVVNADEEIVAANDNWGEDNTEVTTAATTAAKAFRLTAGGRDAALVVTLAPGSYTVVVSGVGDTAGVALVEIYEVP